MDIRLTSRDQAGLSSALLHLLSPLEHATAEQWLNGVQTALTPLFGADYVTFMLPAAGGHQWFTWGLPHEAVSVYPDRVAPLNREMAHWRKQAHLGVWNRRMLYHPHEKEIYASAYYNEYVVPIRAFDAIGISFESKDGFAFAMMHHDRPTGPRFGRRGLGLLRLIQPALHAGVRAYSRLASHREGLARTLDAIGQTILVCDLDGRVLHRAPALSRMLAAEPERERLLCAIQAVTRDLVCLAARPDHGLAAAAGGLARSVRTAGACYSVRGCLAGEDLLGPRPLLLIAVERDPPETPSEAELRERFAFTRKQAAVALLLAQRRSNREIAEALVISPHTAKRHTEQVLHKLGVRSRNDVAAAVRRGLGEPSEGG